MRKWKYFQPDRWGRELFNVRGVSDVGQLEIRTAETLVVERRGFEVKMAIET